MDTFAAMLGVFTFIERLSSCVPFVSCNSRRRLRETRAKEIWQAPQLTQTALSWRSNSRARNVRWING